MTTTTTRAPHAAAEHTAEARRLLGLVRREALESDAWQEYSANYACDPQAVAAVASAHIALALVEEQRTANLVAAYNGDLLKNPHPVGTHEHDVWWAKTARDLTERVGVKASLETVDEAVRADERRQWADYFEHADASVGSIPLTYAMAAEMLRGQKPFGVAKGDRA